MFLPGWSPTAILPLLFYLRARHCHHHHRPAATEPFFPQWTEEDSGIMIAQRRERDLLLSRAGTLRDLITNLPAFCVLWGASLQRPIDMPCTTLLPRPSAFRRRPKTSRRTSSLPNKPTPSLKMGESPTIYRSCRPASHRRPANTLIRHLIILRRLTPDLRSSRLCRGKERAPTEAAQWTPTRVLLSMRSFSKTSSENSTTPCACAHVHSAHAARPSG
jgi:hypothetical protein